MEHSEFFTIKEMTEKLSLSRQTLYRMREDGEGPPCYRVGTMVRYPKDGFEKWMESRQIVTLDDTKPSDEHPKI